LLPVRRWVGWGGWAVIIHGGAEVVVAEEVTERGERDWRREEKNREKNWFFFFNSGL
jgi:hypothetical protein